MPLTSTMHDDVLTIHAGERIVPAELQGEEAIGILLGAGGFSQTVLFDMSRTTYLDSGGINWLLTWNRRFRDAGGTLVLHSLTPMALQVIRLMRLDRVFRIADDAASARQLIAARTS
jgi:anti-anti-sigma factor